MNILLVTHHWHTNSHHSISSGYERIAYYLSKYHTISVLTWGHTNRIIKDKGIIVIYKKVPTTNFIFEKRLGLSYQALKIAGKFDIVHCLYSDPGLLLSYKYPIIVTEHSLSEIDPSPWMRYKSLVQRRTLKRAKLVIAVSKNLEDIIRKKYNPKTVYIPHGVDTTSFFPITNKNIAKKKNDLLKNQFKYVSLSCGIQGVDSQTFQKVVSQFPFILFIVVGRKEKNPISKNIFHPGKISEDQLKEFYSMSDFCFKPLKFATANNAILEAMAMGKATVTNNIPGVTDYLTDKTAYLARKNEDFYDLITSAINNKTGRETKGQNARGKAVKEFSWSIIARDTVSQYNKFLKEK